MGIHSRVMIGSVVVGDAIDSIIHNRSITVTMSTVYKRLNIWICDHGIPNLLVLMLLEE